MIAAVVGLSLGLQPHTDCAPDDAATSIMLNQVGFEQRGPKTAILHTEADHALPWQLVDESGVVRAQGQSVPYGNDSSAGHGVHRIVLSDFTETGSAFQLITCGARSRPFSIGAMRWGRLAEDSHMHEAIAVPPDFIDPITLEDVYRDTRLVQLLSPVPRG